MSPTLRLALSQLKSLPEKDLAALEREIQRRKVEMAREKAKGKALPCLAEDLSL